MPSTSESTHLPLAGFPIRSTNTPALNALLQMRMARGQTTALAFANANFVVQCQHLRSWCQQEEVVVVNDGIGVDIAALLLFGLKYEENLNGTDYVPQLLRQLPGPCKLFLFGGRYEAASGAAEVIEREWGHSVVGIQDGYEPITPAALQDRINQSGAEIVLIALGNPLQEDWMRANMHAVNAKLCISVGALFDFLSGHARRAPRWVQRLRLEWLFRLGLEPRRLLRRYTVDMIRFLLLCLRHPRPSRAPLKTPGHAP